MKRLGDGSMLSGASCLRQVSKRFRHLADAQIVSAKYTFSATSVAWQTFLGGLHNLEELEADLRNERKAEVATLLLGILRVRPSLQKLSVTLNNHETRLMDQTWSPKTGLMFANAFRNLQHLETLRLGGFATVALCTQILCSALQNVPSLRELLVRVAIGNQGVHQLAPCIRQAVLLKKIDLSASAVGDLGAIRLATCLDGNQILEYLDVSHVRS